MKKILSVILCISLLFSLCSFALAAGKSKSKSTAEKTSSVPESYKYLIDNELISGESFCDGGFWSFDHNRKTVTATFTGVDLSQKVYTYKYKNYHENRSEFLNSAVSADSFLGRDGEGNLYFSSSSIKTRQLLFGISFTSLYSPVLVKISPEGELLWSSSLSSKKIYRIYSLCFLENGDMIAGGQCAEKNFNCEIKPAAVLLDSEGNFKKQLMLTGNVSSWARFVPAGDGAAAVTDSGVTVYDAEMCITSEKILKGYEAVSDTALISSGLPVFVKLQAAAKTEKSVRLMTLGTDGATKLQKEISRGKYNNYAVSRISGSDALLIKFHNGSNYEYKIYTGDFKCIGTLEFEFEDCLFALFDGDGYLFAAGKALGEDENNPESIEFIFTYFDKNLKQQWQYTKKSL